MGVSSLRFIFRFAFCCTIFETVLAWQTVPANRIYRIYVEPFATQAGSEEFREDVIAELRKLKLVSLTADESSADAILGDGGKARIKGVPQSQPAVGRSAAQLQPRLYRLPFHRLERYEWRATVLIPGNTTKNLEGRSEGSLNADCKKASRISRTRRSAIPNCSSAPTHDRPDFPGPSCARFSKMRRRE